MEDDARDEFDGFSAMFSVRAYHLRRNAKEADKAADEAISPWKIGMLATCLLLWDIMWEVQCMYVTHMHVSCSSYPLR